MWCGRERACACTRHPRCAAELTATRARAQYTHCDRLPTALRESLLAECLLGRLFHRLFLHWCPEVRRVFHYILVFKLRRAGPVRQDDVAAPPPGGNRLFETVSRVRTLSKGVVSSTVGMLFSAADSTARMLGGNVPELQPTDPRLDACVEISIPLSRADAELDR